MVFTQDTLDSFVSRTDALGSLNCPKVLEYWSDFQYQPHTVVNQEQDPLSRDYFEAMLDLYREISGRDLDQATNEDTALNVNELALSPSPYGGQSPSSIALHYHRLATGLGIANLSQGARVLDMGCGWGLSSELLAYLGCSVEAVDINPAFVDLVSRRALRLNLPIQATRSDFSDYVPIGTFDAVLFYESLHHAVRPDLLLQRLSRALAPEYGVIVLVGEPIQDLWWKHWGLRLDPLSVYCIRKFGWFESGWSKAFLQTLLTEAGLIPYIFNDPDPAVGTYVRATNSWVVSASDLPSLDLENEWWHEKDHMVAGRQSSLLLQVPRGARQVQLEVWNFRPSSLPIQLGFAEPNTHYLLKPGQTILNLAINGVGSHVLMCQSETWIPAEVVGNGDHRALSFHLKSLKYLR